MEIALFATGGVWALLSRVAAERAATGLAVRFELLTFQPLLSAAFLLFLVLTGFTALHWLADRHAPLRVVNPLPSRPTASREWGMGAALGWAMLVATVVPMMLAGRLSPGFWMQWRGLELLALSLATLALFTLAIEAVFRGYLFERLIRTVGPALATLLMSFAYAVVSAFHPQSTRLSIFAAFLTGILLSMAYLRTRALWLPWGLHFAWAASMGALFGLPVGGVNAYSSFVDTTSSGPDWLTGGLYGPEGSLICAAVIVLGMVALYMLSTDFAWHLTFEAPQPGGYAVEAKPPAAHVAMEQSARPAPLVQILPSTPANSSTMPAVEEHLRSTTAGVRNSE